MSLDCFVAALLAVTGSRQLLWKLQALHEHLRGHLIATALAAPRPDLERLLQLDLGHHRMQACSRRGKHSNSESLRRTI